MSYKKRKGRFSKESDQKIEIRLTTLQVQEAKKAMSSSNICTENKISFLKPRVVRPGVLFTPATSEIRNRTYNVASMHYYI